MNNKKPCRLCAKCAEQVVYCADPKCVYHVKAAFKRQRNKK
jgi:hypothetical protein